MLSARLSCPFVDLDDVTPGVLSAANVAQAWETHGQDAFRRAEVVALARVLTKDGQVVALGGGTPTTGEAEALIRDEQRLRHARVVYLRASATTLRLRLAAHGAGANRPSLTGKDPLEEIETVLAARDSLYRVLADEIVECDGLAMDQILSQLERAAR